MRALQTLNELWAWGVSPMENHLWQSTVFAAVAGLLAVALRKNEARVRYWIWLAASLKFLLPFSLLTAVGAHLARPHASTAHQAAVYSAMDNVSQPFAVRELPAIYHATTAQLHASPLQWLASLVALMWLGGVLVVLARGFAGWMRIAKMLRDAVPVTAGPEVEMLRRMEARSSGRAIRLVRSRDWMEPGVFGIFRPVLIWPEGISQHLDDRHTEAILAHEVCHVRRWDNLTAVLHMLVEALFWFHPLVWWMGTRLTEERERACDEEVSLLCERPKIYAESILRVCQFCSESPLACVSGITGADLKKRILEIMAGRVVPRLEMRQKVVLAALALVMVVTPIVLGQVQASQAAAETLLTHPVDPMPRYEVVTVKPWDGKGFGRSLRTYIQDAFGIRSTSAQRLIAPDWINKKSWIVQGKPPAGLQQAMLTMNNEDRYRTQRLLSQSALVDRFGLKYHFETREMPIYELTQAKGGAKLKVPAVVDPHGGASTGPEGQLTNLKAVSAPMNAIIMMLAMSPDFEGAPLVDKTGLTGKYDLSLNWLSMRQPRLGVRNSINEPWLPGPPPSPDAVGPSLQAALEDVGLKLVRTKGPVEVVVIDHIEEPTEN